MTVRHGDEKGAFDAGCISRITPIGRFLRKTKLDELPQLFNVLKGDMSLVGPRPEVEKWVQAFPDRWKAILVVRPGITDPASVAFHDEEKRLSGAVDPEDVYRTEILPRKLDMYERYVSNVSILNDCKIILKTFQVLLQGFVRR